MKKILIAILIIALLFVAYMVFGFLGNPISKSLGASSAKKYVRENYSDEYKLEKTEYSFKTSRYYHRFYIPDKLDNNFTVETDTFGKVVDDQYKFLIEERYNTYERFSSEIRKATDPIFDKEFNVNDQSYAYINTDMEDYKNVELNEEFSFDKIPGPLHVNVNVTDSDTSYENLAKLFIRVEKIINENNLNVGIYSIGITNKNSEKTPYESVAAFNVKKEEWIQYKDDEKVLAYFLKEYSEKQGKEMDEIKKEETP